MINIDYIQLGNTIHNRFTLDLHQTILHLHVRTGTQAHTHTYGGGTVCPHKVKGTGRQSPLPGHDRIPHFCKAGQHTHSHLGVKDEDVSDIGPSSTLISVSPDSTIREIMVMRELRRLPPH